MPDTYPNFADLQKNEAEGKDYRIVLQEHNLLALIIAPHAGKIEPVCSEIVTAIAGEDFTSYCFEGIKPANNGTLHITSANFDEPQALAAAAHASILVAIHGRKDDGDSKTTWVGGLDTGLATAIVEKLGKAGFAAKIADVALAGKHAHNICNRSATKQGTQLEIPRTLRDQLKEDRDMLSRFSEAIRCAIRARLVAFPK